MSDESALLEAILANPDDDTVRLVYADWLQENGQPERAEFIRIECEQTAIRSDSATVPNRWDSPRYWELEGRRSELYDRHAKQWFAALFKAQGGEVSTRRGFPNFVALSARKFIQKGGAIFEAAPTIDEVFIGQLGKNMPELAQTPALGRVRKLDFFETPFRTREAEHFAASPHLGNLRELHIGFTDTQIGPRGAAALARAKSIRQLRKLDIANHAVYDEGAGALLRSDCLATLTRIHLGNNGLTDRTLLALCEADHLKLTSLDLMYNHASGARVAALGSARRIWRGWNTSR